TTAIVPSGGLEQNGPHLAIGKHDRIVAYTARRIAAGLGRALVTPVVSFVPQGTYEPPTGHMRFPGTVGVPVEVFAGTLEGIARSLKAAGFRTICLVADHGDSLPAQKAVAERLSREWAHQGVRVLAVDRYNADPEQIALLKREGETDRSIGRHGGIQDTAELMAAAPEGVRLERWTERPLLSEESGADGDPTRATPGRGATLLALKVEAAIAQIRAATGELALRQSVD
ncbi:MAG: creatininase family protein, partial [Enterovirga sp.]|nr:creatininase family protein [Enterovirga sp.]